MKIKLFYCSTILLCLLGYLCFGQSIAEKKAGLSKGVNDLSPEMEKLLTGTNKEINQLKTVLKDLHQEAYLLHQRGASEDAFSQLLGQIKQIKQQIVSLEEEWMRSAITNQKESGYALWNEPETTLGQLVIEFGTQDAVYVIPPDISQIQLSVSSNLPIPRSMWSSMLEVILNQNGIGIKEIGPYVKQLYFLSIDHSSIQLITDNRHELDLYPDDAKVCFVISPEPAQLRKVFQFLEQFVDPSNTLLQNMGRDILIFSQVGEVIDLLKIYDFVSVQRADQQYRIIPLSKVDADEMARILSTIFVSVQKNDSTSEPANKSQVNHDSSLAIIPLTKVTRAIFLVGTSNEIRQAEEIIYQVESQVGEVAGKVVYWYTVKHSDPEELAAVLERIYIVLVETGAQEEEQIRALIDRGLQERPRPLTSVSGDDFPPRLYDYGYYLDERYLVDPDPDKNRRDALREPPQMLTNNFVVDAKSGSIVMVVEADLLSQMKDVVKKLDVPKKMVQIDVLLFEKRLRRENQYGLNLLRLGTKASQTDVTALSFNDVAKQTPENLGVLQFCLSRICGDKNPFGGYDLAYRFLLAQEDIQINANPSVLTVNQTPAIIRVEEEISVNTGIFEIPTEGTISLKDSFARARYGIKIEVNPTIHLFDRDNPYEEPVDYVTLDTDIIFETIQPDLTNRPPVTRRQVINTVRIPDGQTVILGGLRRKNTQDFKESIPFLGEIPGLGKLFSHSNLRDNSTEMFIFLTPRIIDDPREDLELIKQKELCRRPGDIPEFLCRLVESQKYEKDRLLQGWMTMLFGRPQERMVVP